MVGKKDYTLPILAHVLGWLTSFIGPLIILLASKDKNSKLHSKKALNWQISLIIYYAISFILIFFLIGFILIIALSIMNLIFSIVAAVKASRGELWDYPFAIPFLQ